MADYLGTDDDDTLDQRVLGLADWSGTLRGLAGNDVLTVGNMHMQGGPGDDTLIGTTSSSTVNYFDAPSGILVNLATGQVADGWGSTDTLINVHVVHGSGFADVFVGSDQADELWVGPNDFVDGGGGVDVATVWYLSSDWTLIRHDVHHAELVSKLDGSVIQLANVERVRFQDATVNLAFTETMVYRDTSPSVKAGAFLFCYSADLNQDGLTDLVIGGGVFPPTPEQETPVQVLLQQADGTLKPATLTGSLEGFVHPREMASGDVNGDGYTDVVVVGHGYDTSPFPGETAALLLGQADGSFVDVSEWLPQIPAFTHSVALGDVNHDGFDDIFLGNINGQQLVPPQLWLGGGDGLTQAPLPADVNLGSNDALPIASLLVDLNGDGLLELVAGGGEAGVFVYPGLVNAAGSTTGPFFGERSALPQGLFGPGTITIDIASADINGDGRIDLLLSQTAFGYSGRGFQVVIQGDEGWQDATQSYFPGFDYSAQWAAFLYFVDFNLDGHLDVLASGTSDTAAALFVNDGDGHWTAADGSQGVPQVSGGWLLPADGGQLFSVTADNAGLVTVVTVDLLGGSTPDQKPTGAVSLSGTATQGQTLTASNTLADADGMGAVSYQWYADGQPIVGANQASLYLDAALAGQRISVAANYLDEQLHETTVFQDEPQRTSYEIYQCGNWVSGRAFFDQGQPYVKDNPALVMQTAQLDVNGDGLLDFFTYDSYPLDVPTPNPPPSIFINDGVQLNKTTWPGPSMGNPHGVKVLGGDFNGDEVLDLFSLVAVDPPFGAFPDLQDYNNLLLFGDAIELIEFSEWRGFWYAGASGDIDNDGDLDIIMFNFHVNANGVQNRILWNDGSGHFTDSTDGIGSIQVDQAELIDINHDGYVDLLVDVIDSDGRHLSVYWGNGSGYGQDVSFHVSLPQDLYVTNLFATDLNGDGFDELLLSAVNSQGLYQVRAYQTLDSGISVNEITQTVFDQPTVTERFDHARLYDIDHNGYLDLFATDMDSNIRWEWNGDQFVRSSERLTNDLIFFNQSQPLVANLNDSPTGTVIIAGTATQGQTLTASNTLADADGLGTITYTWKAGNTTLGTGSIYTLTQAEVGQSITVTASYTDQFGTAESVTSAATATVEPSGIDINIQAHAWNTPTAPLVGVSIVATGATLSETLSTDATGKASISGVGDQSLSLTASLSASSAVSQSVNLTDAIAILKLIVGLPVNAGGAALSPYQALAADFDGNGSVQLTDAIGVLKHVVGLQAPKPEWRFVDEANADIAAIADHPLSPGQVPALDLDLSQAQAEHQLTLVGLIAGDVNGSFGG